MSKITIDKDVPVPQGLGDRSSKYPVANMEVGDSFFLPNIELVTVSGIHSYYKRKLGYKLVTRTRTEGGVRGVRIWRAE